MIVEHREQTLVCVPEGSRHSVYRSGLYLGYVSQRFDGLYSYRAGNYSLMAELRPGQQVFTSVKDAAVALVKSIQ